MWGRFWGRQKCEGAGSMEHSDTMPHGSIRSGSSPWSIIQFFQPNTVNYHFTWHALWDSWICAKHQHQTLRQQKEWKIKTGSQSLRSVQYSGQEQWARHGKKTRCFTQVTPISAWTFFVLFCCRQDSLHSPGYPKVRRLTAYSQISAWLLG